jgi:hypothetical protein
MSIMDEVTNPYPATIPDVGADEVIEEQGPQPQFVK